MLICIKLCKCEWVCSVLAMLPPLAYQQGTLSLCILHIPVYLWSTRCVLGTVLCGTTLKKLNLYLVELIF